jgi:hypothetical protein
MKAFISQIPKKPVQPVNKKRLSFALNQKLDVRFSIDLISFKKKFFFFKFTTNLLLKIVNATNILLLNSDVLFYLKLDCIHMALYESQY